MRQLYCFAEIVIEIKSEVVFLESEELKAFRIENGSPQYTVYIKYAKEDEETSDAHGYAKIERKENEFWLAVNPKRITDLSDWQIFVMFPLIHILLEEKRFLLHSSFIIHNNKAILFSGASGIGKSTQASLWNEYRNAEIINGDRSLIYQKDGVYYAAGYFHCGTSGIRKNKTAPIEAIVLLGQGTENTICKAKGLLTFHKVLSQCAYDVENREEIEMVTEAVAEMIGKAKIYQYCCRKDESAVEELERYLG